VLHVPNLHRWLHVFARSQLLCLHNADLIRSLDDASTRSHLQHALSAHLGIDARLFRPSEPRSRAQEKDVPERLLRSATARLKADPLQRLRESQLALRASSAATTTVQLDRAIDNMTNATRLAPQDHAWLMELCPVLPKSRKQHQ
jgi:hypothetical protein